MQNSIQIELGGFVSTKNLPPPPTDRSLIRRMRKRVIVNSAIFVFPLRHRQDATTDIHVKGRTFAVHIPKLNITLPPSPKPPFWGRFRLANILRSLFTARRYASAVLAIVVCPSVCPSVRLSQAGIVSKRQHIESRKQRRTVAQGI